MKKLFFITKYWDTQGVFTLEGDEREKERMLVCPPRGPGEYAQYFHRKDYARTLPEAKEYVEEKRAAKIASTEKKLKKLQDYKFEVNPTSMQAAVGGME